MTEDGWQKTEDRRRMTEDRRFPLRTLHTLREKNFSDPQSKIPASPACLRRSGYHRQPKACRRRSAKAMQAGEIPNQMPAVCSPLSTVISGIQPDWERMFREQWIFISTLRIINWSQDEQESIFKELRRNLTSLVIWDRYYCILVSVTLSFFRTVAQNQGKFLGFDWISFQKEPWRVKGISKFTDMFSILGFYSINNLIFMMVLEAFIPSFSPQIFFSRRIQ